MRRAALLALVLFVACAPQRGPEGQTMRAHGGIAPDPVSFLVQSLRAWPEDSSDGLLAVTDPKSGRLAVYDSALVALVLLRRGQRERAGRILSGLAALQAEDGSLPFSFTLPSPQNFRRLVRSGAIAWVGYAAAEYLDAEAGGRAREAALRLGHRAAAYLLAHQIARPGDPRDGLVRGGSGVLRYDIDGSGTVRESLDPGEIAWTSVEHNVDTYFFLRAFARVTASASYEEAAARAARALSERAWRDDAGQLTRGITERGIDPMLALDCASWGSIFLVAAGHQQRADMAYSTADGLYASKDPRSGAYGHRPHVYGPLLEDARLMRHYGPSLSAQTWDRLRAVWPEGSAGVALAAWRTGHHARARAILDALEPLRGADGSMPTFTADVPLTFDTHPSLAGTAWFELVRFEMERPPDRPTLWPP